MASDRVFLFETLSRVAPLGVRFWDVAANELVTGDLFVTAVPVDRPMREVTATVSSAGIFGFAALPLVSHALAFGKGDAAYWASPQPGDLHAYRVTVVDTGRRFLSCNFVANAPAKGVFDLPGTPLSIPSPSGTVPLFSSVGRRMLPDSARVWVTLRPGGDPIPFAVVQVLQDKAVLGTGLSDDNGQALIVFPYPRLNLNATPKVPLFDVPGKLTAGDPNPPPQVLGQRWKVKVQVLRKAGGVVTADQLPDLGLVMQPGDKVTLAGITDTEHTLRYGTPLSIGS